MIIAIAAVLGFFFGEHVTFWVLLGVFVYLRFSYHLVWVNDGERPRHTADYFMVVFWPIFLIFIPGDIFDVLSCMSRERDAMSRHRAELRSMRT